MSVLLRATGVGHREVAFELDVPTPNRMEHHHVRARRVGEQRWMTRRMLELSGPPLTLPCVVTLTRIGSRLCDSDRACLALAAVRDEVARWLHGLPERASDGSVPRAPDGPRDRIVWNYDQEQRRGPTGVRIEITTAADVAAARSPT